MEKKYIDLHLHSYYSDGIFSPEKVVRFAKSNNLSAISLTDHDTIHGIEKFIDEGAKHDIEIIPGIELSAFDEYEEDEVHILGYYFDYKNKNLLKKLDYFAKTREHRVDSMIIKLKKMGININKEDIQIHETNTVFGRLHVARALVKLKIVKNITEAFNMYLNINKPAYVPKAQLSPEEAINIILDAKGVPIIAHPKLNIKNEKSILRYIKAGLKGIEAYYPRYSNYDTQYYINFADKYDLCVTGGSDYHGDAKRAFVNMKIPYEILECLKKMKHQMDNE
ncbi:PHP domain-containing protein [bacterium]